MPVAKGVRSNHLPQQNCINYKINNKTIKNATTKSDFWAQNAQNDFCSQGFVSDSLGLSP